MACLRVGGILVESVGAISTLLSVRSCHWSLRASDHDHLKCRSRDATAGSNYKPRKLKHPTSSRQRMYNVLVRSVRSDWLLWQSSAGCDQPRPPPKSFATDQAPAARPVADRGSDRGKKGGPGQFFAPPSTGSSVSCRTCMDHCRPSLITSLDKFSWAVYWRLGGIGQGRVVKSSPAASAVRHSGLVRVEAQERSGLNAT